MTATRWVAPLLCLTTILALSCGKDSPDPVGPPGPGPVATLSIAPGTHSLVAAATVALNATLRDADGTVLTGRTITWSTSAAAVATVSSAGVVTGVGPGTATITATSEGRNGSATITVQDGGVAPPTGGTVTAADGKVEITVPSGATAAGIAITVAAVASPPAAPTLVPGTAHELGPAGTVFAQPVAVQLSFADAQVPAGTEVSLLRVHRWNGTEWEALANGTVDPVTQTARGETLRFSTFAVMGTTPPVLVSLSATSVRVGSPALVLTVSGDNFVNGSTIHWNGAARTTTFVSSTELTATIPASDFVTPGPAAITVANPGPGFGVSEPQTFVVVPATIAVTSLDDTDDGSCTPAHCSLREALTAANGTGGPHRIEIGAGTITLTSPLPPITGQLDLVGPGPASLTLDVNADETNDRWGLRIAGAAVADISGLTIRGARVTGAPPFMEITGGGVEVTGTASLRLANVVVRENRARSLGAGISIFTSGPVLIEDALIEGNETSAPTGQSQGAGIYVAAASGNVVIRNSRILNNTGAGPAALGAGIFLGVNAQATRLLEDVEVRGNVGSSAGAGIYIGAGAAGSAVLNRVTVADNVTAGRGGGIWLSAAGVYTITNSTISGNSALLEHPTAPQNAHGGGGIFQENVAGSHLVLTNVTVSGNAAVSAAGLHLGREAALTNVTIVGNVVNPVVAVHGGAGIRVASPPAQPLTMTNVILAGNVRAGVLENCRLNVIADGARVVSHGNNLSDDTTCNVFLDAEALNDKPNTPAGVNPVLASNGGPTLTHALLAGSAAINAGNTAACPSTDQRGFGRNGACDIGAVEFGGGQGSAAAAQRTPAPPWSPPRRR